MTSSGSLRSVRRVVEAACVRPRGLEMMAHPTFLDLTQRIRAPFFARGHLG